MSVFSVEESSDDVELVLRAVGDAVRRWEGGEALGLVLFGRRPPDDILLQRARQLRLQARIDREAVIHSTRPHIGPLVIRFQRLVRRLTWWFSEPMLQQIAAYQLNNALLVEGLADTLEALKQDVADLGLVGEQGGLLPQTQTPGKGADESPYALAALRES